LTKSFSQTSPDSARRLVVDLPCSKKSLARARHKIVMFASEHGFGAEAQDIALAAQEALKNIIQYAHPADNNMHFECTVAGENFTIDVIDQGSGFDVTILEKDHATPMSLHGRGIKLIRGLMDSVRITSDSEGTVVHMQKKRSLP